MRRTSKPICLIDGRSHNRQFHAQSGQGENRVKTLREATVGNATVRLLQTPKGFAAAVFEGGSRKALEEGDDSDDVWRRAQDAAARLNPSFFGYDGARSRFLSFFPSGFEGSDYVERERKYKLDAKHRLDVAAPLDQAAAGSGYGEAVLSSFRATNLLFRIEKTKLQPLLRGPEADHFIQAAAAFANGDIRPALIAMRGLLKPYGSGKWTVVTYLPFLWRPDVHVFLKPTMLCQFAERVGNRFALAYSAELDCQVYEALLDMASETRDRIADLKPLDMIDVQSFMWTAVEYTEADRQSDE
jgi:hypothetical protein